MNTLPRAIVAQVHIDSNTYTALREQWSGLMNCERKHELTAAHHLLYLSLLGKDWRKAFTPPTNQRKLENGAYYGWQMFRALAQIHAPLRASGLLAPFDGLVTAEMLQNLRALMPKATPSKYTPPDFANNHFPFRAYDLEAALIAGLPLREALYD